MTVRVNKEPINLREKLAEVDKPSGIAGEAMLRAETPQEQFNLIGAGRKNLIINGGFQVSQRGDYTTATSISAWTYYADRFKSTVSTISGTIQYTGDTVKLTATSTGSNARILTTQGIERINIVADKTYTLSAKVKSNTANARLLIYINGAWQAGATHSGSGQWEDLSVTVTSQSAAQPDEVWVRVGIMDGVGNPTITVTSGEYVEARLLQLELGKVATPFEHRSYGEELALCQRYCQVLKATSGAATRLGFGQAIGTSSASISMRLTTPLRVTPSLTYTPEIQLSTGTTGYSATGVSIYGVVSSSNLVDVQVSSSGLSTGQTYWLETTALNSYLTFDAEL